MRERRRDYELMMIISTLNAGEAELTAVIDRIQKAITDVGGNVTEVDNGPPWGRRKLAYPMREFVEGEPYRRVFNEGFYSLIHFNLPAAQIAEVERVLKLTDSVLRHMLTLVDPRSKIVPMSTVPLDDRLDDDDGDEEDL